MNWDWSLYSNDFEPKAISAATRDDWAEIVIDNVQNGLDSSDITSGDSVVVAVRHQDGNIRVYDCVLRRESTITEDL